MKKKITIIPLAASIALLLAACGEDTESAKNKTEANTEVSATVEETDVTSNGVKLNEEESSNNTKENIPTEDNTVKAKTTAQQNGVSDHMDIYESIAYSYFTGEEDTTNLNAHLVGEVMYLVPNSAGNVIGAYVKATNAYESNIVYVDFTAEDATVFESYPTKNYTKEDFKNLVGEIVEFEGNIESFEYFETAGENMIPRFNLKTFKQVEVSANAELNFDGMEFNGEDSYNVEQYYISYIDPKTGDSYEIKCHSVDELNNIKNNLKAKNLVYKGSYTPANSAVQGETFKVHMYETEEFYNKYDFWN